MNAIHFLVKSFFLVQLILATVSTQSNDLKINPEDVLCQAIPEEDVALGVWEYTMTKVKSPYTDGVLCITKQQGTYNVAIIFSNGTLTGQDVNIAHHDIKFNMNVSGLERVSFVLLVDGDRIIGESYSKNGSSHVIGSRKYPGS